MKTALIVIGLESAFLGACAFGFVIGRAFERVDRLRQAASALNGLTNIWGSTSEDETP